MVDPHWVQVPPRSFNGPYMDPKMDFNIFEPFTGCVYHLYIVHSSRAPLNHVDHFIGHCGTLPRLRGPSRTFMDPPMDTKMDPAMLNSGYPW